jgi:hypothetical protein
MGRIARIAGILLAIVVVAVLSVHTTTHAQGGGSFGGILTYDPTNDWILFTDQTGTWHAPIAITNSAAPTDNVVEFTVNTDDQFVAQVFGNGTPKSALDIDPNGAASLWGSAGGGIGVDNNNGDTCIPSIENSPCGPTSLRINYNGEVSQYLGQPTSGHGISTIQYWADTTLTGTFGPYTIFTTGTGAYAAAGMYRVTGYMTVTGSSPGSAMQFVVDYKDEGGFQSQTTGTPVPFGSVGEKIPFSFEFYSVAGQPITISMIATGGNPVYGFHVRLEEL